MRRLAVLAAAMVALAGCGESSAPETFDPSTLGGRVAQAFGTVPANKAVQAFDVMSSAFTFSTTGITCPGSPPPATGVLPANVLGRTFVYHPEVSKYQLECQGGAPSAGVRFYLYAVDTVSRAVSSQIGNLDITDKSSAAANTIGIAAVVNNATILSYDAAGSIGGGGTFSFTAKGNVMDGSNRLDFDISQSVAGSGAIQVNYKLSSPSLSNIALDINATATSSTAGTASLAVTDNADKLEIAMNTSANNSTGTVKFNGNMVANVAAAGNADPTFTAAGGQTLSESDKTALKQLYKIVDQVLNRFDDVLFPAYFVFGLVR